MDSDSDRNKIKIALKLGLLIVVFSAFYMVSSSFRQYVDLDSFLAFIKSTGPMAPLVYCGIYLIGPTIFLPASILTMAGGAVFGPVMGTIYTIFSATLGATIPFLLTRKFGRGPLEKVLGRYENFDKKFKRFENSVEEEGWKYVAFTRLVTIFPFLILNYAFGLTKIRLWTFVWATFVFMLPGSFMFNYFGYAGREALSGSENAVKVISIAIGFFLLMSVMPNLVKLLKKNGTTEEES